MLVNNDLQFVLFFQPSVVTICPSPASMAGQLSIVELEHFSFLGAQELVAQVGWLLCFLVLFHAWSMSLKPFV